MKLDDKNIQIERRTLFQKKKQLRIFGKNDDDDNNNTNIIITYWCGTIVFQSIHFKNDIKTVERKKNCNRFQIPNQVMNNKKIVQIDQLDFLYIKVGCQRSLKEVGKEERVN